MGPDIFTSHLVHHCNTSLVAWPLSSRTGLGTQSGTYRVTLFTQRIADVRWLCARHRIRQWKHWFLPLWGFGSISNLQWALGELSFSVNEGPRLDVLERFFITGNSIPESRGFLVSLRGAEGQLNQNGGKIPNVTTI